MSCRRDGRVESYTALIARYAFVASTYLNVVIFVAMHLGAISCFFFKFSWRHVVLCLASYNIRMFGITAGYHRYFSHRSYDTSRCFQFCLAFVGSTAVQKGVLWWASTHRHHHKFADEPEDIHSPLQWGFWWSHMGWFLWDDESVDPLWKYIPDLTRYPELVWINKFHFLPPIILAGTLYLYGGFLAFLWGFVLSTVLLWHATFTINSLAHVYGSRRFPCEHHTNCSARNNLWLALLTLGEGWHNNHHSFARAARNGFYWWEIDVCYYVIRLLECMRLVRSLRMPPLRTLESKQLCCLEGVHEDNRR